MTVPRADTATMSPDGVTRFCLGMGNALGVRRQYGRAGPPDPAGHQRRDRRPRRPAWLGCDGVGGRAIRACPPSPPSRHGRASSRTHGQTSVIRTRLNLTAVAAIVLVAPPGEEYSSGADVIA